jgi:hypothetical protein
MGSPMGNPEAQAPNRASSVVLGGAWRSVEGEVWENAVAERFRDLAVQIFAFGRAISDSGLL